MMILKYQRQTIQTLNKYEKINISRKPIHYYSVSKFENHLIAHSYPLIFALMQVHHIRIKISLMISLMTALISAYYPKPVQINQCSSLLIII